MGVNVEIQKHVQKEETPLKESHPGAEFKRKRAKVTTNKQNDNGRSGRRTKGAPEKSL